VRQILINLVLNAIEAIAAPTGTVTLTLRAAGRYAQILVTDDGPGVADDHLPLLGEPFFTTKAKGGGLGLAICRQLAESNGGTLAFDTRSGRGLTVVLRLRLADDRGRNDA
jgi:two-component system sensor histidine kinase AtoS